MFAGQLPNLSILNGGGVSPCTQQCPPAARPGCCHHAKDPKNGGIRRQWADTWHKKHRGFCKKGNQSRTIVLHVSDVYIYIYICLCMYKFNW